MQGFMYIRSVAKLRFCFKSVGITALLPCTHTLCTVLMLMLMLMGYLQVLSFYMELFGNMLGRNPAAYSKHANFFIGEAKDLRSGLSGQDPSKKNKVYSRNKLQR